MTASLDLSPAGLASAILSERVAWLGGLLADDRDTRPQPEPRAQSGACKGLKRTTSGSEPAKLPVIGGQVLNKTAVFYDQGEPGASAGQSLSGLRHMLPARLS